MHFCTTPLLAWSLILAETHNLWVAVKPCLINVILLYPVMAQWNAPAVYPLTLISDTFRSRPILPYRAPTCQCVIITEIKQSVSPRPAHLGAKRISLRALPLTVKFSLDQTRLSTLTGQWTWIVFWVRLLSVGGTEQRSLGVGSLFWQPNKC